MSLPCVLIQLDPDRHPSVFDAMVGIDSGVDHLLQYAGVEPEHVQGLVHGAIFTRGLPDLKRTAFFVGGSSVAAGERLLHEVCAAFVGPMKCSVMFDGNGSNTTAAAAVLSASRHFPLAQARAVVLGGTGPVGSRVARLMVGQGATVCLVSRERAKAESVCQQILQHLAKAGVSIERGQLQPCAMDDSASLGPAMQAADVVYACGAAGAQLLSAQKLAECEKLKVAIDLNAVPPVGIEGIGVMDKAVNRGGRTDYGAIGVGGLKMKIHKAALRALFESNERVLDAEEIFVIGQAWL